MSSYLISGAINLNVANPGANALSATGSTATLISSGLDPQTSNIGCPTVASPNSVPISFIIIDPATGTITDREDCFITSFTSGTGHNAGATITRGQRGTTQQAWPEGSLWIATPGSTRTVLTYTPGATPTINVDTCDVAQFFDVNANISSMSTNFSGSPIDNQQLIIEFFDDGSSHSLAWGDKFESSTYQALPTTTPAGQRLRVGLLFDSISGKMTCVAVS